MLQGTKTDKRRRYEQVFAHLKERLNFRRMKDTRIL